MAIEPEWYAEKRRRVDSYFVDANLVSDKSEILDSPSGKYRLTVLQYHIGPGRSDFSRGIVTRIADGAIVADIKRNYDGFPYSWIEHRNGNEYLICGEDYQGYTIVNLTQELTRTYIPEEAQKGFGFCWIIVYPSPDRITLAVAGCIWACPQEVRFYDFSDPDQLPLAQLGDSGPNNLDDVIGWEDTETFIMKCSYEVRKSDGVHYWSLSAEEQAELDQDSSLIEEVEEIVRWRRPAPQPISNP